MSDLIIDRIETARAGTNPTVICRVQSGWVVMCDMQFLSGYCILLADPPVVTLNDLDRLAREQFLLDMTTIGDALMEVTGAYRINYAVAGNTDPWLHAHIVPRYMSEPEHLRKGLPWSHPKEELDSIRFDLERDKPLMEKIRRAIENLSANEG
jgi:diadenosine tetraphosphate (Ap4A) HIT family hydrolase